MTTPTEEYFDGQNPPPTQPPPIDGTGGVPGGGTGLGAAMSVASNVKKLTSEASPLMQAAQTEGLKIANRRGLLNSSMAADASQDAMIRNALPIAQQDADIAFRTNLFDKDAALRKELQSSEFGFNSGEKALDRALQEKLQSWSLDAADRGNASQFLVSMENMYQNQFNQIMANTAMSAEDREKFLLSAKNLRDIQLNFVEQLYNIDLEW